MVAQKLRQQDPLHVFDALIEQPHNGFL